MDEPMEEAAAVAPDGVPEQQQPRQQVAEEQQQVQLQEEEPQATSAAPQEEPQLQQQPAAEEAPQEDASVSVKPDPDSAPDQVAPGPGEEDAEPPAASEPAAEASAPPPEESKENKESSAPAEAPAAGEGTKRQRRSRWASDEPSNADGNGSVPPADTNGDAAAAGALPPPPPPPQRRHRWGPPMDASGDGERRRKKRSRWEESDQPSMAIVVAAPPGMGLSQFTFPKEVKLSNGLVVSMPHALTGDSADPRIRRLHEQLKEVDRKIEQGIVELPPEGQRSPSPEPVYDRNGVRLNTREIRYKEKLLDQRHRLVEELIKEDPHYRPPADYKPRKFQAKVRIPQDEYPTYNFIGLLIGPRGNTQKRMQQETNTKIAIRGRGSVKEGAHKDPRHDMGEDEELHVLVTGNTQHDVDRAVAMIELLCRPDDDSLNEHKRLQLRELAALNGTLKDEVACPICGEFTHRGYECPNQKQELYVLPDAVKAKVEEQYARDVARLRGADALASEDDYKSFLRELGGAPPPELMGEGFGPRRGLGMGGGRGRDLPDDCKLYVGSLPPHYTDAELKELFDPYGNVNHASVIMDSTTGQSRCFGFVHFDDAATARTACDAMQSKQLEGRYLVVRVRSDPPSERGPRDGPGGGFGGPRGRDGGGMGGGGGPPFHDNTNTLYVTALNPTITESHLRSLFESFAKVSDVRLITDKITGQSRGYAFITMASQEDMMTALMRANGYQLEGRAMVVKKAGEKGSSGGPPFGGPPPLRGGGGYGGGPPGGGGGHWGGPPRGGPPPPGPHYGGGPPGGHYGGPPPPMGGYGHPPPGGGYYPPPGGHYGGPPPAAHYGGPPPGAYYPPSGAYGGYPADYGAYGGYPGAYAAAPQGYGADPWGAAQGQQQQQQQQPPLPSEPAPGTGGGDAAPPGVVPPPPPPPPLPPGAPPGVDSYQQQYQQHGQQPPQPQQQANERSYMDFMAEMQNTFAPPLPPQ